MAYRLPERLYRRCGPEQQHPRRYPPPDSFNLDSSYHTRGGTPSFPLPETRGHHPPSYGDPGFPAREPPLLPPIHLFDNHRSNDGHHWNDDPSLQETDMHYTRNLEPSPRERYHDRQSFRGETVAGFDFHEQLPGPHESRERFHDDAEWENVGFSMSGGRISTGPLPLMQTGGSIGLEPVSYSGPSSYSSQTGFDIRSRDWFPGEVQQPRAHWPSEGMREREPVRESHDFDWQQRQSARESTHFPRHGFESELSNYPADSHRQREELLGRKHPRITDPEPPFSHRSAGSGRSRGRRPPPKPQRERGRRRGRGRGGRGGACSGRTTPPGEGSVPAISSRSVLKSSHRPSSVPIRRESRSGDRARESIEAEKRAPPVKKSPAKRRTSQTSHFFVDGNSKGGPLSPRRIQQRLGPHIPGSGSVQNRLGPPKKGAAGVHSRLGPEDKLDASLEDTHSAGLKSKDSLSSSLSSEVFQFRLGPEENRGSSLATSSRVHSRLGPEGVDVAPPTSLEGSNIPKPLPPLTSVHSRLGPKEIDADPLLSRGLEISDPRPSDGVHSRLGPDENSPLNSHSLIGGEVSLVDPIPADSVHSRMGREESSLSSPYPPHSHLGRDDPLSESHGSQSVYLRLGPEQSRGSRLGPEQSRGSSEGVRFHLEPSPQQLSPNAEPSSSEALLNYAAPGESSSFQPLDLAQSSSGFADLVGETPQLNPLQSEFPRMSDTITAVEDPADLYMVIDDAAIPQPLFSEPRSGFFGGECDREDREVSSIHQQLPPESHVVPSTSLQDIHAPPTTNTSTPSSRKHEKWNDASRSQPLISLTDKTKRVGNKRGKNGEGGGGERVWPSSPVVVVGESIPTLLQKKVVPPPAKKPRSGGMREGSGVKVDRNSPHDSPVSMPGYRGDSSGAGDVRMFFGKERGPYASAVGVAEEKEKVASLRGLHADVVGERENLFKVGVATVVRAEREMEEGELTDSEDEGLVIDLDTSFSSATHHHPADENLAKSETESRGTPVINRTRVDMGDQVDTRAACETQLESENVCKIPSHNTKESSTTFPALEREEGEQSLRGAAASAKAQEDMGREGAMGGSTVDGNSREESAGKSDIHSPNSTSEKSSPSVPQLLPALSSEEATATPSPSVTTSLMSPLERLSRHLGTNRGALPPALPAEQASYQPENHEATAVVARGGDVERGKSELVEDGKAEMIIIDLNQSLITSSKAPGDTDSTEEKKREVEKAAAIEDDVETVSISSGEIVSSTPPSPSHDRTGKDIPKDTENANLTGDHYTKSWDSIKEQNWRGRPYLLSCSPPDGYGSWRGRSPVRKQWSVQRRGRCGHKGTLPGRRRCSRSQSLTPSPPPVFRREWVSSRHCSSPEIGYRARRRRDSRSFSPDNQRVRRRYSGQRRRGRAAAGERRERCRGTQSSRSCDRMSERGTGESSDEDLEVLELRKEAILSMLTDGACRVPPKGKGRGHDDGNICDESGGKYVEERNVEGEGVNNREGIEIDKEKGRMLELGKKSPEVSEEAENVRREVYVPASKGEMDTAQEKAGSEGEKRSEVLKRHAQAENREILQARSELRGESPSQQWPPGYQQSPLPSTLKSSSVATPSPSPQSLPPLSGRTRVIPPLAAGKRAVAVEKLGVARVTRSGSGSGIGSPSSSCGSPAPPLDSGGGGGGGSGMETLRRGTENLPRSSTSVRIVPGSKGTWEVPEFHIQLVESEEEGEGRTETESEVEDRSSHRPPTMEEIDSILGTFRREAEAKARSKEKVGTSPDRSSHTPEEVRRSPEVVAPRVDLEALGMLPLPRQREYLELKTKLALHARRQREEERAVKAKDKGKRPLNATLSKRAKVVNQVEQVKSTEGHDSPSGHPVESAAVALMDRRMKNRDDDRETKENDEKKKQEEERKRKEQRKREEEEKRKEEQQRNEEARRKREREERERKKFEKQKKKHEMKIAELEGKIRSCRSQSERWTKMLSAQTRSLVECESEIEEHELKIELLSKQLDLARTGRDKCKKQKKKVQDEVQVTRVNIGRHASIIQDTQQLLIRERESLIAMEGDHGNNTNTETVPMEIDSDGSKGEEEMEIVTSSEEESGEINGNLPGAGLLPPLTFEAISDTDDSTLQSSATTEPSHTSASVPVSGRLLSVISSVEGPSRCRGKRRRMSRSQRTRKSSLSVSHSVVAWASDSETEDSETRESSKVRKQVSVKPPIPSSPPPLTPPPPPRTPSPPLSASPSSLFSLAAHTLATTSITTLPLSHPPTPPTVASVGRTKPPITSSKEWETDDNTLPKRKEGLVFSATLPVPPIEVEFITDTDTASESGLPCPGSIPLVPFPDHVPPVAGCDGELKSVVGVGRGPSIESNTSTRSVLVSSVESGTSTRSVPSIESNSSLSVPAQSASCKSSALASRTMACVPPDLGRSPPTESLKASCEKSEQSEKLPPTMTCSVDCKADLPVRGSGGVDIGSSVQNMLPSQCDKWTSTRDLSSNAKEGDASSGGVLWAVDPQHSNADTSALEHSPMATNMFLSMLKISKVESLSESSDAFSPVAKSFDPLRVHDPRPISTTSPTNDSPHPSPTTKSSLPSTSGPSSEPRKFHRAASSPNAGEEKVRLEEQLRKDFCRGELVEVDHEMETPQDSAADSVFVTFISSPHRRSNDVTVSASNRPSSRTRRKKEVEGERESGGLGALTGAGGKMMGKSARRNVGKLPLSRCGSDSVITMATTKNRRKSTPNRFFAKTADSSPTFTSNSPMSLPLVIDSPTLNEALQATLTTALAPALENVLNPSSPAQGLPRELVPRSTAISPTLSDALQHTLDLSLPASVRSLPGFHRHTDSVQVAVETTVCCEGTTEIGIEVLRQPGTVEGSYDHEGRSCDLASVIPGRADKQIQTNSISSPSISLILKPLKKNFAVKSTGGKKRHTSKSTSSTRQPSAHASRAVDVGVASGSNPAGAKPSERNFAVKSTGVKRCTATSSVSQVRRKSFSKPRPLPGESASTEKTNRPKVKFEIEPRRTTLSVDSLLGKIRQVKSNLEKQGRSVSATKGTPVSKQPGEGSKQAKPGGPGLKLAKPVSLVGTVAKELPPTSAKPDEQVSSKRRVFSKPVKRVQQSKSLTTDTSTFENSSESGNRGKMDTEVKGPSVPSSMDDIVRRLDFEVTWGELQRLLKTSADPSPSVTGCRGNVMLGNPLLSESDGGGGDDGRLRETVVSESAMESAQPLPSQGPSEEATFGRSSRQLRRYKPYTSPLLSLPAYRLNQNYRTQERLSLASLSHSNKIDPGRIWCRYELFGTCGDPQCTWQHLHDITPTKSELVNDIVAYSPAMLSEDTQVSKTDKRSSLVSKSSEKVKSYGESLVETYSGKMSEEQLLMLAAHRAKEAGSEVGGGGVFDMEELRAREMVGGAKEGREKTRPPALYWEGIDRQHLPLIPTTAGDHSNGCSTVERYFTVTTTPNATPPNPNDPAHFLSLARGARDQSESCKHLESGLSLHPSSQDLWVEYLETKCAVMAAPGRHDDEQAKLLGKAIKSCPTYAVVAKSVQLAATVGEKSSCIVGGYHAITAQTHEESSLSLYCTELLLSHTYLHCEAGCLKNAVSILKLSLAGDNETENKSLFRGISGHLSPLHLQLAYLCLVHLLYTSTFPQEIFLSSLSSSPLPLRLKQDVKSFFIPWSKNCNITEETLQEIETLLTVGASLSQFQEGRSSCRAEGEPAMTFALLCNLLLFRLVHRSEEAAWQSLLGLLDSFPRSAKLWSLAAQFEDWTSNPAMALKVLERSGARELDFDATEFYGCAVKLVMKQGVEGCHGDVLTAALPWLRSCVCRFYDISEESVRQLSLTNTSLLFRKLLGQMVPYSHQTPERVRREEERESLPFLWIAYCLLVQLSHHTLQGSYHHLGPEEAFESAVHSVNRPSHLRIVWLEYLSYLRDVALKRKGSHTAFKALSDCVYRCLVVMDTKQAPPTSLPGQPNHYHNYSFQEQVCDLFFGAISPSSKFALRFLETLVGKVPDSPCLVARYCRQCLDHTPSSLGRAQAVLASFLSSHPHSLTLWKLAIDVELVLKNRREVRWMYREAVKYFPFSTALWKEFLLFEIRELSGKSSLSPSLTLAQEVVTRATDLGLNLTHTLPSSHSSQL